MTKFFKHWQDPVNALIGLGLFLSPWLFDFSNQSTAAANAALVGIVLMAVAIGATVVPRAWEEWTEVALGLWLVVSPWVLGFADRMDIMRMTVGAGVVVLVLAAWTLATDKDYNGWMRGRMAH
ncbi:SPW repeat protein [Rhizobacter sp. Root1221]|uniref:SPW repeat protein n=1 Tax=Rhizobacter sp. Root1221 TaxID=1736433 RepID=UPI0006F3F12C|nr:SPW repeat protein [Rhizobacter sp. Root1221]KQV85494.1 hypothetical protein ASC87_07345 [Rhizobacter sp. Root1221]